MHRETESKKQRHRHGQSKVKCRNNYLDFTGVCMQWSLNHFMPSHMPLLGPRNAVMLLGMSLFIYCHLCARHWVVCLTRRIPSTPNEQLTRQGTWIMAYRGQHPMSLETDRHETPRKLGLSLLEPSSSVFGI